MDPGDPIVGSNQLRQRNKLKSDDTSTAQPASSSQYDDCKRDDTIKVSSTGNQGDKGPFGKTPDGTGEFIISSSRGEFFQQTHEIL